MYKFFGTILSFIMMASVALAADATKAKQKITLTKDNILVLNSAVYEDTAGNLMKSGKEQDSRIKSSDPIYLILNTPGGSIDAGLEMIEFLKNLRRPVHTISVFAASMGFQTVQGLGDRLIVENGTLMSHKARGGFYGELPGQLDSRYNYYLKRIQRLDEKAAARTKGKHTLKSYRNLIENEYWCDGQDCIDQGFADAVVEAECDKSLDGTHVESEKFFFMGMAIQVDFEYANCPMIMSLLGYKIYVDGKPLFKDPAKPKTDVVGPQPDKYSIYSWYSSDTSSSSDLSKEVVLEIKNRVQKVVDQRTKREVVKGY